MGRFGPRGLASIVFALIVLHDAHLPDSGTILSVIYVTVALGTRPRSYASAPDPKLRFLVRERPCCSPPLAATNRHTRNKSGNTIFTALIVGRRASLCRSDAGCAHALTVGDQE
jgi:hypothetical protein